MKRKLTICIAALFCAAVGCKKDATKTADNQTQVKITGNKVQSDASTTFANGSDVSWVTQMEASGLKYYNSSGTQQDLFTILKGLGINSIRLRAWVNPSSGWCNTSDLVAKAVRAKNAGMNVMIDFHYSDTWPIPATKINLPRGQA